MILAVTNTSDVTADFLLRDFYEAGVACYRLDTDKIPEAVQFGFEEGAHAEAYILDGSTTLRLSAVSAIWWRRPVPPRLSQQVPARFLASLTNETAAALSGILRTWTGLWVNHPDANAAAEFKLLQLNACRHLGWDIPRTIVTCDPDRAAEFVSASPYPPVVKSIRSAFLEASDGTLHAAYARQVDWGDVLSPDAVRLSPVLLQEFIPKRREYRVTVVGHTVFATEIRSSSSDRVVDWRAIGDDSLYYVPAELPADVQRRCLQTLERFHLRFAALDIIEATDGRFVFLEINPNGQWAWIEMQTGQPIRSALRSLLCTPLEGPGG